MSDPLDISAASTVPKYRQTVPQYASPIVIDEEGRRWAKASRYAREKGLHPSTLRRLADYGLVKARSYGRQRFYLLDCIE